MGAAEGTAKQLGVNAVMEEAQGSMSSPSCGACTSLASSAVSLAVGFLRNSSFLSSPCCSGACSSSLPCAVIAFGRVGLIKCRWLVWPERYTVSGAGWSIRGLRLSNLELTSLCPYLMLGLGCRRQYGLPVKRLTGVHSCS